MSIPISALQRNAARLVRRVAESRVAEEITDRGRVVAVLAPPPAATGLARLRELGAVIPAEPGGYRELLDEIDRLPPVKLMDALAEQRDTDR